MGENERNVNTEANEVEQEVSEIQQALSDAKRELINGIYNAIDYRSLFKSVGQVEKYEEFAKYVEQYDAEVAEIAARRKAEEEAGHETKDEDYMHAAPRTWFSFLDDKPISSTEIGLMYDQILNLCIHISLSAAQVINGVVYDTIIGKQFMEVQHQHEQFAGAIGEIHRRLEAIEKVNGRLVTEPIAPEANQGE